ncbi:MAG TPA: HD domain-containing phosphohydrolase [Solirubrobacteraceae bacterium]
MAAAVSLEPQAVAALRTLTAHAARLLGVGHATVLLRESGEPGRLGVAASVGLGAADADTVSRCLATADPVLAGGGRFERGDAAAACACVPIVRDDGTVAGVLAAAAPGGDRRFDDDDVETLAQVAAVVGGLLDQAQSSRRLAKTLRAGIEALASLLDLRDGYTARDAGEVARLAGAVGGRLGLDDAALSELDVAARVHDLGKIGVPDAILQKPGRLDAQERAVMERHAVWGAETLGRIPGLEGIAEIVRSHHERWDGRGYPAGLAGTEIPVAARIIGACEAYRALTSDRPYRRALDPDRAAGLLAQGAGGHFDPDVIEALLAVVGERGDEERPAPTAAPHARPRGVPPAPAPAGGERHPLPAAFERLDGLPALAESRDRVLAVLRSPQPSSGAIADAVESDVGLLIAVLRLANRARAGARIAGVRQAVQALTPEGVEQLAGRIAVADFFERRPAWPTPAEPFRAHAVAVRRAADRLAEETGFREVDELLAGALLHDVGKLVLGHAYPGYPDEVHAGARTPDERIRAERRALGIDHALVGGVLLRRWGLPTGLARAVERHHTDDPAPEPALLRLADMLAQHAQGAPVDPQRLLEAARRVGLTPAALRAVMFELPTSGPARRRPAEPCPLTDKELATLRGLAEGKVYKEIAADLGIATSTVRSHLHKTYRKVGASDRAQAVLMATERGWL